MYFDKFLTTIKNTELKDFNEAFTFEDKKYLLSKIDECRICMLSKDSRSKVDIKKDLGDYQSEDYIEAIDLPFKVCWFEFENLESISVTPFDFFLSMGYNIDTVGLFVEEVEPKHYKMYMYSIIRFTNQKQKSIIIDLQKSGDESIESYKIYIQKFLNILRQQKPSLIDIKHCIIYRNNINKKVKKFIQPIIYVGSKAETNKYLETNKIPYAQCQYRFEVRGHWRKLSDKQTGKDREGIRNTKGYTWVSEYEKGNREAPLIKKIRKIGE